MAVQVADAFIPLTLDLSTFEQQAAEVEARIDALQARISGLQSAANSINIPNVSSLVPQMTGAVNAAVSDAAGVARSGGASIGSAMMTGGAEGVASAAPSLANSVSSAVNSAIDAGKRAAEVGSPSKRAEREIGSPIMAGVAMGLVAGTPEIIGALRNSIGFAFSGWLTQAAGGQFVGPGLNVVSNPGGVFGGGGWGAALLASTLGGVAMANPTGPGELSRSILGQFPGAQQTGDKLVEGIIGSILPGWAAGPISDLVGTFFGTQPILTRDQALAPATYADDGGFEDYPYGGGSYIFNNEFNLPGNFTDVERQVQMDILQSMRRLGIY